ncbi:hypothetical protein [uncultured Psychroserpens sp.]|uniref:hypothetical protein n=1 Tax=uncultured Psychroserpens sp. TaxID=255436 RepID=UPI00262C7A19|nr:hypothetical protein [uncultured Psychroserpens sp.]
MKTLRLIILCGVIITSVNCSSDDDGNTAPVQPVEIYLPTNVTVTDSDGNMGGMEVSYNDDNQINSLQLDYNGSSFSIGLIYSDGRLYQVLNNTMPIITFHYTSGILSSIVDEVGGGTLSVAYEPMNNKYTIDGVAEYYFNTSHNLITANNGLFLTQISYSNNSGHKGMYSPDASLPLPMHFLASANELKLFYYLANQRINNVQFNFSGAGTIENYSDYQLDENGNISSYKVNLESGVIEDIVIDYELRTIN